MSHTLEHGSLYYTLKREEEEAHKKRNWKAECIDCLKQGICTYQENNKDCLIIPEDCYDCSLLDECIRNDIDSMKEDCQHYKPLE